MDKKQVKQIKNFPTKTLQKTNRKQANKNMATNINNTEGTTKKPTTQKILDQKTHWFNNNHHHSIFSTTNLPSKKEKVPNVV